MKGHFMLWDGKRRTAAMLCVAIAAAPACAQSSSADPLPSWNDGLAKTAILDFVRGAVDEAGPKFVPPAERIATFDQDGTLWVEQPMYGQVMFALARVKALAPEHPEWKSKEPFRSILAGDGEALAKFTIQDFEVVVAETHSGMTVEEFRSIVKAWLATAKRPRFKRSPTELVYQPMLEVMALLRANGFKTYIVTGGGQDFVRVYADSVYGVPPEQVIGSAGKTAFELRDGRAVLVKQPKVLLIDDKAGKPEAIDLVIGKRPVAAFGNSDGDREMLEYTDAGAGRLMMLVRHDDAEREFAYGPESKVGTFSDALAAEARKSGWTVISMKNDWKRVFAFEE